MKLVFLGDSVTDCSRKRAQRHDRKLEGLGNGWVRLVYQHLVGRSNLDAWNRGYAGCLTSELMHQDDWWPKSLTEAADVTTIMIGVNDVWHPFWRGLPHDLNVQLVAFERLLITVKERSTVTVVCESLALPVGEVNDLWWPWLLKLSEGQRALCQKHQALWWPLRDELREQAQQVECEYLYDGVHPTDVGHRWLAERWLDQAQQCGLLVR